MKELTPEQIKAIVPRLSLEKAAEVAAALNPAMEWADITSPERQAAFLAQCAHESDGFKTMREYASGRAYEGREDLGNTEPGDGVRFKGRGYIQITGRYNYAAAGEALEINLLQEPERAEAPELAGYIAAWYWYSRELNYLADDNNEAAFRRITRKINGGLNGLADRLIYWGRAKETLGA